MTASGDGVNVQPTGDAPPKGCPQFDMGNLGFGRTFLVEVALRLNQLWPKRPLVLGIGFVILLVASMSLGTIAARADDDDDDDDDGLALVETWVQLFPSGGPPPGVADAAGAFDPLNRVLYIFGGHDGSDETTNFWKYTVATNTWSEVVPSGASPPKRGAAVGVWDDLNNRFLLFGGNPCVAGPGCRADLWAYSPGANSWTQLASLPASQKGRAGYDGVWDPVGKRMLFFGGHDGIDNVTGTFWAYDAGSNSWATLSAGPPDRGGGPAAVWDDVSNQALLFGGLGDAGRLNDLWSYARSTETWTELTPAGPVPSARTSSRGIWDSDSERMLVFGGRAGVGLLSDLWAYSPDSDTWTELIPSGTSPQPRSIHVAVWDSAGGQMLIFGGEGGGRLNDLWALRVTPTGEADDDDDDDDDD